MNFKQSMAAARRPPDVKSRPQGHVRRMLHDLKNAFFPDPKNVTPGENIATFYLERYRAA